MAGAAHGRGLEPGWEGAVDRQEGGWTGGQAGAWAVYRRWGDLLPRHLPST